MGKLQNDELRKMLSCIPRNKQVTVPPMPGYDSGVHLLDGKYVVISTDPCLGVPEDWFGWLLINYAASDVALFGAKPEFCTINLLGPANTLTNRFLRAMKQACQAAQELNMAIVTGHTGSYEGLSKMVGVCTAYGTVEQKKLITPGDAKPGDLILSTKPVGLEIFVNFSITHKLEAQKVFGVEQTRKLSNMVRMQGCVSEALQLAQSGGVHAMHDATEGGFVTALNELAEASKLGFKIDFEQMPITFEAKQLQKRFKLSDEQVLAMSSTGTILVAVDPHAQEKVAAILNKNNLAACFLGEFTENRKRVLVRNKKEMSFPKTADDPYATILSGQV
jgi:hydrogenase expression/formation protein HypE